MKRLIGLARCEEGASFIEFALLAPILALLVVGLIEVSRFTVYSIQVGNAARAGVQYGSQNLANASDTSGMVSAATADAENISNFNASATVSCTCADASPCDPTHVPADCASSHRTVYVTVNAAGKEQSLLQLPYVPTSFTIGRTVTMQVQQQ